MGSEARGHQRLQRRSLGILPKRSFGLVCAVLDVSPEDRADAERHHVELEALVCAREAVAIYAALFARMPQAFERNLAIAVGTFRRRAAALGRNADDELKQVLDSLPQSSDDAV